jgi:hypothetical protein
MATLEKGMQPIAEFCTIGISMTNTAREHLLRMRSGYVQQMDDAAALIARLPEDSDEAEEACQSLANARNEIAIIDGMLATLSRQ